MHEWAEFRHFRYLLTILEKRGFRAAAEELHTAQPNLSVQARQFQENASVHLFRRLKHGGIRPTETGVAFMVLAKLLLETLDEVLKALTAIERGDIRSMRFGCTPLADRSVFHDLCATHKEILPGCPIRPTHGDTAQLAEEIISGTVDAAIVTLPLTHPDLHIEELHRDRLVVCLRRDNPLAAKSAIHPVDLQGNLTILYHPQRHPDAHQRLLELLGDVGVTIDEHSWASHPSEMQALVKEGQGLALIREGTKLDEELITRPIAGVDWTVDTAVIYHKSHYPKTIPVLLRKLRRKLYPDAAGTASDRIPVSMKASPAKRNASRQSGEDGPVQLTLLG
ncbi:MAG: LysR family transcriptional regulator [Acidobacteriota bacterium]